MIIFAFIAFMFLFSTFTFIPSFLYLKKSFEHTRKQYFWVSINFCLAIYVIYRLCLLAFIKNPGLNYYDLRRTIPFFALFMSNIYPETLDIKKMVYLGSFLTIFTVLIAYSLDIPLFPWLWFLTPIEYTIFAFVFFEVFRRKINSQPQALAYALLMLPIIGYTFELPIMEMHLYSFWLYPFLVRSVLLYIPLMVYIVKPRTFLKKQVLLSLCFLVAFDIWYMLNPIQYVILTRIPTFVFWLVAALNMESSKK